MNTRELKENQLVLRIRLLVVFFILALIAAGLTAFPLETELKMVASFLKIDPDCPPETYSGLQFWIATVTEGIVRTNQHYPFLAYGTDWLAFAHLVIAVAFIGLYREPVRNKWIIYFGMISCAGVIPLALIGGAIRGIPFYWQMIDCSFGVLGMIPLWLLHVYVKRLEVLNPCEFRKE
jgi:hypothetical protein